MVNPTHRPYGYLLIAPMVNPSYHRHQVGTNLEALTLTVTVTLTLALALTLTLTLALTRSSSQCHR